MRVDFVGPDDARMMIVGEAPGEQEDLRGEPFCNDAPAGKTFNWLLSQAGINRHECLVGNAARERPPANNMSYYFLDKECTMPKPIMQAWLNDLKRDIIKYNPNVIVGMGRHALWALTGQEAIGRFRGYCIESTLVPGKKVVCTWHPSHINRGEYKAYFPAVYDLRKAKYHAKFAHFPPDRRTLFPDAPTKTFIQYCKEILSRDDWPVICLDIETLEKVHISIVGIGHSPYFAMSTWVVRGMAPAMPEKDEAEFWYWLGRVLEEKEIIIQNASYDALVVLYRHGIWIRKLKMDTLIAAHSVWPELPRDLGFLTSMCLDVPAWKHLSNTQPSYYNASDVANTFGIANFFEKEIDRQGVREIFNFEMRQLPLTCMLQLQGTLIDKKVQLELAKENQLEVEKSGAALEQLTGKKINYRSSQQMQQLLYGDLKLPMQYKRRKTKEEKRTVSTDKDALKKLERLAPENPMLALVLKHREHLTRKKFLEAETSPDGKFHTSYNITGKKIEDEDDEGKRSFGRWSSSESIILPYGTGNLQNIPEAARTMYVAPPGFHILTGDFIQAEAVVVAYLSGDRRLVDVFKSSFGMKTSERKKHPEYDVHILKAADLFSCSIHDVTKDMRRVGKTIRHARNYSAGPGVVQNRLGCTMSEAKILLDRDNATSPHLKAWHESIRTELVRNNKTLYNLFGRVHRFLDRWGDTLFRSAYSFKPQSTIGDLMNRALVRIYEDDTLADILHIWLQLHDAGYWLVPDGYDDQEAMYHARRHMLEPIPHLGNEFIVIDVDFHVGKSWGGMDEIDYEYEKVEWNSAWG